jgi:hypothetical protein
MVSKCPEGFQDGHTARKCRSAYGWQGVPFTDGVISFKNFYCAVCHGKAKDLEPWVLKKCNATSSQGCKLYLYDPPDEALPIFKSYFVAVRPCLYLHVNPRALCSLNETELSAKDLPIHSRERCGMYNVPLKYAGKGDPKIYKDVNCLLCNGIKTDTNVSCYTASPLDAFHKNDGPFISFKVLLDFAQFKAKACSQWELLDIDLGKCQPVVCSEGFIFNKGHCRKLVYVSLTFSNDTQMLANLQTETRLLKSIDVGNDENTRHSFGYKASTSYFLNTGNVTKFEVALFSRKSPLFKATDLDFLVFRLNTFFFCGRDAGVVSFDVSSYSADGMVGSCTRKGKVVLGSRERRDMDILANISKETSWKITGDEIILNLTSFLCVNGTRLSCPKVLYPKQFYKWKNGAPVVGKSFSLQTDQFEIVKDYVFICRDALLEKWALFQGFATDDYIQGTVTLIGSSLSLAGLAYTLLTYTLLAPLRTLPGKMLMHLCVSLFLAQLVFVTALNKASDQQVCTAIAMAEHYLWLVAFFWMNTIAWNSMMTFTSKGLNNQSHKRKSLLYFTLYSWGVPGLIITACAVVEFTGLGGFQIGYGNDTVCWISDFYALLFAFALPVGLVVFGNVALFSCTMYSIYQVRQIARISKGDKDRQQFWLYVKLSSVMGLTWMFGFLASVVGSPALWYVFIVFNTTQGLMIGMGFSFNKRIFRMYSSEYSASALPSFRGGPGNSQSGTRTPAQSSESP